MDRFKNMTFGELDNEIDKLPYNWMKALCYDSIRRVRNDYKYKTYREGSDNNDRKSKSKSSRQSS